MMNKKLVILFDIDKTLLNTNQMVNDISTTLTNIIHLPNKHVLFSKSNKYIASLSADREFDPKNFVDNLSKETKFEKPALLLKAFYGESNVYQKNLFPDTLPALKKLSKIYRLGIYSEGTLKFQHHKLKSLKISNYLEKKYIYIFKNKTSPGIIKQIPSNSVVVDDKEPVVKILNKYNRYAIWINRLDNRKLINIPTIYSFLC